MRSVAGFAVKTISIHARKQPVRSGDNGFLCTVNLFSRRKFFVGMFFSIELPFRSDFSLLHIGIDITENSAY